MTETRLISFHFSFHVGSKLRSFMNPLQDDVVNTTLFLNAKGAAEGSVKINGHYVLVLNHSYILVACSYSVWYSRLF